MPGKDKREGKERGENGHADHARFADDLCVALLQPRTAEEMRALLADIATPAEIRALAERWRVARLLDDGKLSYREIADQTGVSTTTITRVARFLRDEPWGGYRLALERSKRGRTKLAAAHPSHQA